MKRLIGSTVLAVVMGVSGAALAKSATTTFSVTGWHCAGCSGKTEAALKKVKGVQSVTADSDNNTVQVAYDDSVTNEKALQAAIKKSGYEAAPAKAKGEPEPKKN